MLLKEQPDNHFCLQVSGDWSVVWLIKQTSSLVPHGCTELQILCRMSAGEQYISTTSEVFIASA